jgi:hypothetical protein
MFESPLQQLQVQFYNRLRNSAWSSKRHVTGVFTCGWLRLTGVWTTAGNLGGSTATDDLSTNGAAFARRASALLKESGEGTGLPDSMPSRGIMCSKWTRRHSSKNQFVLPPPCFWFSQVGTCQTVRDVRAVNHHDVVFISAVCYEPWFAGSASAGLTLFGEPSS